MTQHILKTDCEVFEAIQSGAETHTIRKNDRNFAVGDELLLRETEFTGAEMAEGCVLNYTGRTATRVVSYVLTGYGLEAGWCILSFASCMPVASESLEYQLPEPVRYAGPGDSHPDIYDATQVGAAFAAGRAAERARTEAQLRALLSEPVLDVAAQAVEASADVWTGFARNDAAGCLRAALDAIKLLPTWGAVAIARDAQRYRAVRLRAYAFGVGHPSPEELDAQVDAHLVANGKLSAPAPAKCEFCRVAPGALHKDSCIFIGLNGLPQPAAAESLTRGTSDGPSIEQMHVDFEAYLLKGRDGWTEAMFKKTPQGAYLDRDLHWRFKGWMDKTRNGAALGADWTRVKDQLPERMPEGRQFSREVIVVDMDGSRTCRVSRVHYYQNMDPVWDGGEPTHWCDFPGLPADHE